MTANDTVQIKMPKYLTLPNPTSPGYPSDDHAPQVLCACLLLHVTILLHPVLIHLACLHVEPNTLVGIRMMLNVYPRKSAQYNAMCIDSRTFSHLRQLLPIWFRSRLRILKNRVERASRII